MHSITRNDILDLLRVDVPVPAPEIEFLDATDCDGFVRWGVRYFAASGELVPAFLLLPSSGEPPYPAVVVHHQHAGQRHLGKSEVCGLAGDPLQAFGPALARRGVVVLAPDSICFESRRPHTEG